MKKEASGRAAAKKAAPEKKEGGEIPDVFKPLREMVQAARPKNSTLQWLGLAIFVLIVLQAFLFLLNAPLSALEKFAGSALLFAVSGEMMRGWMGWDGFFGLILFKDRSTLAWIDRQAQRYWWLWNILADLGLVMGYGLCSYFLLSPRQKKPLNLAILYGFGLPVLFIFSSIIAPMALGVLTGLVSHNDIPAASSYLRQTGV
ncbi:MAG: hypothetical protein KGH63_03610, partial [Candidatus Micrarchaeota archaeon]|nr:hypothetical protein [Candidatus Micrarchaeota archaeon]